MGDSRKLTQVKNNLENEVLLWQHFDREESVPRKPSEPAQGIGEFPFNRGETPIFNFDEGDEAFLQTIPSLIDGLHDMTRYVQAQTKLPSMYSKVFLNCPDCKQ